MIYVEIDGNNFSDLDSFYTEVELQLTKNCGWGRNLDAFNDILAGGFGVHDHNQNLKLVWLNSAKSRDDLGWSETIRYLKKKLKSEIFHSANKTLIEQKLEQAQKGKGQTLFDILIDIIRGHQDYIDLELK